MIVVHLCKYMDKRMFTYITAKNVKRTIVCPLSGIHSAFTETLCCLFLQMFQQQMQNKDVIDLYVSSILSYCWFVRNKLVQSSFS